MTFGDNGYIYDCTELFIAMSEELSYPAFESIATNCVTDLATHCYTQARVVLARVGDDNKMGRMITLSLPPDFLVFARSTNSAKPGKVLCISHPMVRLFG